MHTKQCQKVHIQALEKQNKLKEEIVRIKCTYKNTCGCKISINNIMAYIRNVNTDTESKIVQIVFSCML